MFYRDINIFDVQVENILVIFLQNKKLTQLFPVCSNNFYLKNKDKSYIKGD